MGKLIKPEECPKCMPEWLAAFGDLMSLLLCFFVLLLSMATMDAKKMEAAVGSLAGALSVLEGGARPDSQVEKETDPESRRTPKPKAQKGAQNEVTSTVKKINELLTASGAPEITMEESEDGFIVRLPAAMLFDKDSAEISGEDAKLFLKRIGMIIAKMPNEVKTDIIGYTDNTNPSKDSIYKNNWQLSTARALSVLEELVSDGVPQERLITSGRASFDPIASNNTDEGRAKNNRVEIHFVSLEPKNKEATKKSILDTRN